MQIVSQSTRSTLLTAAEAHWVKAESVRQLMVQAVGMQKVSFTVMTVMAAMVYGQTPTFALVVWYALSVLLCLCRMSFLNGYSRSSKRNDPIAQATFFSRYANLDPLISFAWGFFIYFFSDKVPPNIQSLCLITVASFGIFSATYLSSHLRLLHLFLGAYSLGLIGAIAAQVIFDQAFQISVVQIWVLLLVVLFVLVLKKVGTQMNHTYIKSMRLQYRNEQLIASLTQETQTAMAAVATKNRLIASTAHDMRQPILALDLYAKWLTEDPTLTTELTPKIAVATRAVISLFDSMFDLAQLAEGQVIVNLKQVNIKALLEDLCTQHLALAQSKQLALRTRLLDTELLTDPLLLKRIVGNLIANAIKYTQTGGLLVACRQTRRGLRIEVWDTGSGIAEAEQSLVFDAFYKSPAHAGTNDGFGLGLSIVTQLTDKLNYKLRMRSRPGRGTLMAIELHPAPDSLAP